MRHFAPPAELLKGRSPISALRAMEPLFTSAGLGVWHLDLRSRRLWWSERTRAIHDLDAGCNPAQTMALDFYPPDARSIMLTAIETAIKDGTSWDLTLPLVTAKGRDIVLKSSGLALVEDGLAVHLLGICEDRTAAIERAQEHGRLALVVEQMTNAAIIADREGRTLWVNAAFETLTGYSCHDLYGKTPGSVLQGPGSDPETVAAIREALAAGLPFHGELLNYGKNGKSYWIELSISPIHNQFGELTGFVAIESEATAQREAQATAAREIATRRDAETLLRDILDAVPTVISAYDQSNRLLVVNRMKRETFPRHFATLEPGMPMEDVLRGWFALEEQLTPSNENVEERVQELVQASQYGIPPFETKLSEGRWLLSAARRSESGNLIWVRTDISQIKSAELAAREQAKRDALTGLLNRNGFLQGFKEQALEVAQLTPARGCLAIFDIDHFKSVNDVYGHEAGDMLLKTIAKRLKRHIRGTDLTARLGGDEFALFLPGLDERQAQQRLETIWTAICRMVRLREVRIEPSISMGVAPISSAEDGCEALMRRADRALYEAKGLGRGRIAFYTDRLADEMAERRRLADRLHRALTANQVGIALQPQLRLKDNKIVSFEALARWYDGTRWVSPEAFVAAAELHGLAEKLGYAVMRNALNACKQLRDVSEQPITVAVNVGTCQLLSDRFVDQVFSNLEQAGLPPDALEIEITETVIMDRSFARIEPSLLELRGKGVRLSLDDFGTGHASLSHLGSLSIDSLKIDRSFVAAIGNDDRRELIARTIVSLAIGLGLECIAEGVETDAQWAFLKGHGCSHIQGYLIGKPMPVNEALIFLQEQEAAHAGEFSYAAMQRSYKTGLRNR